VAAAQWGQVAARPFPHSMQNLAPSGFWCPQMAHVIAA
jgi:hypothetical protein